MSYKDDNEAYELKQRQIDAMEQALLIARGISRAESAEIVAERKRLQDAYRGDPGVNPEPGVWINPEGEDVEGGVPIDRQEATKANGIAKSLLGDEFSTDTQWNVNYFPDRRSSPPDEEEDFWADLPAPDAST
ncbi:hypothetical protein SAMN04489802_3701 [Pseudomonas chlororaphis]|uniref:hypothetical protein n=1 Tax=Pseudomonas chlororaphis TaxID=587753 RepID=UPI00087A7D6F|nr:hypothetical protein [Pseudomonas chlororaphis]AZD48240.1 hypothetical protein C4K20_2825 [Pseudomonas chlororaphis subsp. aurantiaca]AZD66700.1 hypothetical protein C4K17_2814 [Pseudomonas chlororaphis subsp. aurantiaca]AZD79409.1 hypothetical protein C4K15_2842 [Pseudomonas chlororaphis subsp. aurantiaca]QIT22745.1 hypothetical protein HCN09_13745 [Pseudomonas chlororaphis subsp. aurantiaca]WDH06919.1 hypothetical protein PUP57_14875 [Pseudomonas chlororaphis]